MQFGQMPPGSNNSNEVIIERTPFSYLDASNWVGDKLKEQAPNSFRINGREYMANNNLDQSIADLQAACRIAMELVSEARKENNHHKEVVAAKLHAALLSAGDFATYVAEGDGGLLANNLLQRVINAANDNSNTIAA